MTSVYIAEVSNNVQPEFGSDISKSLFNEYERVLVESIVTSFGLDFLIKDQHGGDVDTIHNVRQIGKDEEMTYKNDLNAKDYEERGEYKPKVVDANGQVVFNSNGKVKTTDQYRGNTAYRQKGAKDKAEHQDGNLHDAYRNMTMNGNEKRQLDHVISAKEVHDDAGRVLSGLDGVALANDDTNLQSTHGYINNIKREHSAEKFVNEILPAKIEDLKGTIAKNKEKLQAMPNSTPEEQHKKRVLQDKIEKEEKNLSTLESVDKDGVIKTDKKSRENYDRKLATAYYTSKKFAKDTAIAAGKVGFNMGLRQALGFVVTEIWFGVKAEFLRLSDNKDLKTLFEAISNGIKTGLQNARLKYKELFSKFFTGAMSGILSSLTTTLCNIFFTTAKNVIKVIRQTYASLVEALKILFINPDNLPFGERMRAVAKVLATGASIVVGSLAAEAIAKMPFIQVPGVGEILPAFIGSFVTGIMTCTLLHYLDKSEAATKLVAWLNKIQTIDADVQFYRQQAMFFEEYAAQLMHIDINQFRKEVALYETISTSLDKAASPAETNMLLKNLITTIGVKIPWEGDFDSFMKNKNTTLVFG